MYHNYRHAVHVRVKVEGRPNAADVTVEALKEDQLVRRRKGAEGLQALAVLDDAANVEGGHVEHFREGGNAHDGKLSLVDEGSLHGLPDLE